MGKHKRSRQTDNHTKIEDEIVSSFAMHAQKHMPLHKFNFK